MRVEELSMYGKALEIPKEGLRKQMKVVLNLLRKEFRRSCTIAKGGDCCHFQFFRKGTAPKTRYLNQ